MSILMREPPAAGHSGAQEAEPDHAVAGHFLQPGNGDVALSGDYLCQHHKGEDNQYYNHQPLQQFVEFIYDFNIGFHVFFLPKSVPSPVYEDAPPLSQCGGALGGYNRDRIGMGEKG